MWQNHLNYPSSSAQAITIKATLAQRTSNGTILGLSGNIPIQPPVLGSNKHTPHEAESKDITTTILQHRQSSDYNMFQSTYYKTKLCKTVIQAISVKLQSLKSSRNRIRRLQHVIEVYQASPSKVSLVRVIASRRRIPLYGPARRQRAGPRQTSDLVLKTHT